MRSVWGRVWMILWSSGGNWTEDNGLLIAAIHSPSCHDGCRVSIVCAATSGSP